MQTTTLTRKGQIGACGKGVDFADALLASASAVTFFTFDQKLVRQRRRVGGAEIQSVPKVRKR